MRFDDLKKQCEEKTVVLTDAAKSYAFVNDESAREKADEEQIQKWILAEQKGGRRVLKSEIERERKTLETERAERRRAVAVAILKVKGDAEAILHETKATAERLVPYWEIYSERVMRMSGGDDYTLGMMRMGHDVALARVEQDLSAMTPAATRVYYARAQAIGDVIAMEAIERHGVMLGTVRDRPPSDADINEQFKLSQDVRKVREARWPDEARTLAAAIAATVPNLTAQDHLKLVARRVA